MKKIKEIGIIFILSLIVFVPSCNNAPAEKTEVSEADTVVAEATPEVEQERTFKIFGIPSPVELAVLLKKAGVQWDESLLNTVENREKYTSNIGMALNLGVYSADLSFASIFDQSQAAITYIAASKKLAEELNILDAISPEIITRMEEHFENKDSLMSIISETLMNSDSFLKESDRVGTSAVVLAGGWVEGLHFATKVAKASESNAELMVRITDQRFSLSTLLEFLNEHKAEEGIDMVIADLEIIKAVYDKIEVTEQPLEVITDSVNQTTLIKNDAEATISDEIFEELCNKVEDFRTRIVDGTIM